MAGLRVIRGPDWERGHDDGGEGHLGTVVNMTSDLTADVVWDKGTRSTCNIGKDGKHDLLVFDNATVGRLQNVIDLLNNSPPPSSSLSTTTAPDVD